MSKKFMLFVIDTRTESATPHEMAAIDAFNDTLRAQGHWLFAGGLAAPSEGNVIDNRHGVHQASGKPLFDAQENYSGFWLIQAPDLNRALQLAHAGSQACHRKVELRPLLG